MMTSNRRGVLSAIVALSSLGPMAIKAMAEPHPSAVAKPGGRRFSVVKGDPGERAYAEACADQMRITVFLNGVEQTDAVTADERDGYVVRAVRTSSGNIAVNMATGEVYHETVFGDVRVVLAPMDA